MNGDSSSVGSRDHEMTDHVTFMEGNGDLPMVEINSGVSRAELYLHGAQVTHFQKAGEPPLLFLSKVSRFEEGVPIRGGIPIILPWFGSREGESSHGFARRQTWQVRGISTQPDETIHLRLHLPPSSESSLLPPFVAEYSVSVGATLVVELTVTNTSNDLVLTFENCLHTYFAVEDVSRIRLLGLKNAPYLDQTDNLSVRTQSETELSIPGEIDRIYVGHRGDVQIVDPVLGRRIIVAKRGSASTVVWNPWTAKSQVIPDLGNDEYRRMICVESGNVGPDKLTLGPGESASLLVRISSEKI